MNGTSECPCPEPEVHIPGQLPQVPAASPTETEAHAQEPPSHARASQSQLPPLFPLLEDSFLPRPLTAEREGASDSSSGSSGGGVAVAHPSNSSNDLFASSNRRSTRERLHDLKGKAKTVFNRDAGEKKRAHDQLLQELGYWEEPDESTAKKAALHAVAHTAQPLLQASSVIAHPRSTVKAKLTNTVATGISSLDKPSIPRSVDAQFVAAHNRREDAIDQNDLHEFAKAESSIQELHRQRKNMMLGWTMGRHVHAVKRVPQKRLPRPERREFLIRDEHGNVVKDELGNEQVDWLRWLGRYLLYGSQDFAMHYVEDWDQPEKLDVARVRGLMERIFVASAPWQQWLVKVKSVYRWEDPHQTFRWFALYVVLWYYSRVLAFLYGYIVYGTLRNYFFPSTVDELRESIKRTRFDSAAALRFGELVQRHGAENWINPVAEELGPWAQLQLADIANLLEVLANFWSWRSPRQSFYTVCFFFSLFLVSAIGDMELCMKIAYFVIGLTFFFSFPVSSHYPKYRYLVSPLKWALWNIPTNAEWAFEQLRLAAQNDREDFISAKIEDDWTEGANVDIVGESLHEVHVHDGVNGTIDAGSEESFRSAPLDPRPPLDGSEPLHEYKCIFRHRKGRLALLSSGVRFEIHGQEVWRKDWRDILELRKIGKKQGASNPVTPATMALALEIRFSEGDTVRLEELGNVRDEVFNRILGFSGLRWQCID